jgi:hypothetical protein
LTNGFPYNRKISLRLNTSDVIATHLEWQCYFVLLAGRRAVDSAGALRLVDSVRGDRYLSVTVPVQKASATLPTREFSPTDLTMIVSPFLKCKG